MSNFTEAIKTAIILFPLVALVFTVPYVLYQYHKYGSVNSWRTVIIYSFILYMMSAYFLVILPLPSMEYVKNIQKPVYNLHLFKFVSQALSNTGLVINDFSTYFPTLKNSVVYEAIFNVLLTVPFGIYLHYYFECSLPKTIFLSFCLTLFFELTQLTGLYFIYPRSYRIFDVDDLFLNTMGGLLGYGFGSIFKRYLPSRQEIDAKSYQKGVEVSLMRRIACFGVDMFIVLVLTFLFSYIIYKTKLTKIWIIVPLILYYLIALMFKRSVGMTYLKLEFKSLNKDYVERKNIIWYYLLFFMGYFGLPAMSFLIAYQLHSYGFLAQEMWEYVLVVLFALTLMIYIISFLQRIFHNKLLYELLSKLVMTSTIKKQEVTD